MPTRYKATLAYDGTRYAGWQVQPGKLTVQGELERVLRELTGEEPRVHSSGRTDGGVHARAQVAHFDLEGPKVTHTLAAGMNALLDADVRIANIGKAAGDFHARYSAIGKEYRYHIWTGKVLPPHLRLYRDHVTARLNMQEMQVAADLLVGTHDFAAFAANSNREVDGTVRALDILDVRAKGHDMTIIARGNGFLYKMVRSLAGFLLRVGKGEVEPQRAGDILESRKRTATVPTAPPEGLFLWRVFY